MCVLACVGEARDEKKARGGVVERFLETIRERVREREGERVSEREREPPTRRETHRSLAKLKDSHTSSLRPYTRVA